MPWIILEGNATYRVTHKDKIFSYKLDQHQTVISRIACCLKAYTFCHRLEKRYV